MCTAYSIDMMTDGCAETVSRNGVENLSAKKKTHTENKNICLRFILTLCFSLHLSSILGFDCLVFIFYLSFVFNSKSLMLFFVSRTYNFHLMRTKTAQCILLSNYCFRSIIWKRLRSIQTIFKIKKKRRQNNRNKYGITQKNQQDGVRNR